MSSPPAVDPALRRPRRTRRGDLLQFALIVFFVGAFFANAAGEYAGWFRHGYFPSALFLSLAASVALYYFLETVAKVESKTWNMAGAGAVFVIILGIAVPVMGGGVNEELAALKLQLATAATSLADLETQRDGLAEKAGRAQTLESSNALATEQITALNDKLAQLERQLAEAERKVHIDGRVINAEPGSVRIGVFFDGFVYSGEDQELRFRVNDVPVDNVYRIFIYDGSVKKFNAINSIVGDLESLKKIGVFNVDAAIR